MPIIFIGIAVLLPLDLLSQNSLNDHRENSLYSQAIALLDNRNHEAARSLFEKVRESYPESSVAADAQYYEAYCALVLYHGDGEKLIGDFIRENPSHPKAALAYYELGNFYYKSRNYPKVIEYFQKVDHGKLDGKRSAEVYFKTGYSYFSLRKLSEALPFFNRLKSSTGAFGTPSSYYAGYIEFQSEDYQAAILDFDRAERDEAYSREIPYMKASALFKAGKYDELLQYTEQKLSGDANFYNVQTLVLLRAEALFMREDFELAVQSYDDYLELVRGRVDDNITYRIALSRFKTGDDKGALDLFKGLASRRGEIGIYSSYYLGILYLKSDNKRYALTAFDKVRKSREDIPLKEEAVYQHAKLAFDLGNSSLAITSLESYMEDFPSGKHRNEISEILSDAYLSTNDYARAIRYIDGLSERTENLNRVYQKANFLLGTVQFNKRDYRRAVSLFDKSLHYPIDPEVTITAMFWKAEAYSIGRRFDEAIKSYLEIRTNSNYREHEYYFKSAYGLGYCYYNLQQYDNSRIQFTQFIGSPGNASQRYQADAYIRLGDCYYIAKAYDLAIDNYNKSISMGYSDRDYANLQIGIVKMLQDKPGEARTRFDRVLATGPASRYYDDGLFQKAQLLFNGTDYDGSIDLYTRLISEKPSSIFIPFALMRRASAYFNKSQYAESAEDYIRLINDYVTHELAKDALLPLQEVLGLISREGEYEQYLMAYRTANPDEKGFENIEFESSKNQYFNQQYTSAIKGLRTFLGAYPEDPRRAESIYYIGDAYYRLEKFDSARIWLERIDDNTGFWQYPRVVERLADLELNAGNYQKATYYYGVSESLADNKRLQNQARTGRMLSYYNLANYDSTISYARKIIDSGGTDVDAENRASLYLGKSLYAMGRFEEAKDEFLNTTNLSKNEYGAEAQYLLGEVFYRTGKNRQSIEVLIDLNEKYPSFLNWVGRGFLLISENYVAMGDFFQARGTLTSLVENFPDDIVKREAGEKLRKLDILEERQLQSLDSLSTDSIVVDSVEVINPDTLKNGGNE